MADSISDNQSNLVIIYSERALHNDRLATNE